MFSFFGENDINSGVKEFKSTNGAILLDVRTKEEFEEGHIPNSINVPKIFVYCYSGARSADATRKLNFLGYINAKNIGGIANYNGEIER